LRTPLVDEVDEYQRVVDDDPRQTHQTHQGDQTNRLGAEKETAAHSDEGEGNGSHDDQRLRKALKLGRQDRVDEQHRDDERQEQGID